MSIKIAIVEDQQKIIDRLIQRLSFFDDIEIIFSANNADQAIHCLEKCELKNLPEVILMDIEMPGKSGIELTGIIKSKNPEIDILIQTVFENDEKIFQSIQAGASGYLLKDDPIQKYVDAIHELSDGKAALSPLIASKLMNYVKNSRKTKEEKAKETQEDFSLTDREIDILKGIVEDLTEPQIGEKLFISHHTVRTHIKNIYKKLHVHSRASAVRFAISKGLIP
ncbi:MAG TPA: DNA-binding response regulator [Balneola sp.]|jgi:DNA-binding NarL/FixJ family response regulator|nr:DNA-binding response regulator [Bacteroidota bacterium]MAC06011.1 DNA-binding response regulator [Balneola sp.]MAO77810.1 DNA-binding response regulator [Balneola sp.]MBF63264.1 DNA-binding response regulator [Balneola sp.]HAH52580.1 DNA-binding response regulator [Balneola sp.]|tara:strand:+ start:3888 stop:4559 length:672 start_codon:yes stop_codon:yes gene_type:complete